MQFNSFSVVIGDETCNANCPFCISKMTKTRCEDLEPFNRSAFIKACILGRLGSVGIMPVILTGKGEPLIYSRQISDYMRVFKENFSTDFPIIELQTNGILVKDKIELIDHWKHNGLTTVNISVCHHNPTKSNEAMGISLDLKYSWIEAIQELKQSGMMTRLCCVLAKGGIETIQDFEMFVDKAHSLGVDQVTFRDAYAPDGYDISDLKSPLNTPTLFQHLAVKNAKTLLTLPYGGVVYDYRGQNVCLTNCMTRGEEIARQMIYWPNGHVTYDWDCPSTRII